MKVTCCDQIRTISSLQNVVATTTKRLFFHKVTFKDQKTLMMNIVGLIKKALSFGQTPPSTQDVGWWTLLEISSLWAFGLFIFMSWSQHIAIHWVFSDNVRLIARQGKMFRRNSTSQCPALVTWWSSGGDEMLQRVHTMKVGKVRPCPESWRIRSFFDSFWHENESSGRDCDNDTWS